jgi:hypothetical protein
MTTERTYACRRCRGPAAVQKHPARGYVVIACRNVEGCGERSLPMPRRRLERRRPRVRTQRPAPASTWGRDQHWRDRDEQESAFWGEQAS